jgi:hypothetical protein
VRSALCFGYSGRGRDIEALIAAILNASRFFRQHE